MSEELKCPSCQKKDKEIASLIADLDNLRHFCDSIFEMAKRNNGVLYFKQYDDGWYIKTGKGTDDYTDATDINVGSIKE